METAPQNASLFNASTDPEGGAGGGWNAIDTSLVHLISISKLLIKDSPRLGGVDDAHVAQLAECGESLPPIVVHRQTMQVIDGMHRLRVAELSGRQQIEAVFFDGSAEEAFIHAVELNIKHGLPLALRDRKAAARRILATSSALSDRTIGARTGLSSRTVAAIRARSGAKNAHLNRRRGRDGRVYPVDGTEGRKRAGRLITERPDASLREIACAAGVSPATVSDVRKRMLAGEEPASGMRAQDHAAARRQGGDKEQAVDTRAALEQLRSDPAVRGREAGRELLRWLARYAIDVADMPNCTGAIPAHRRPLAAALARQNAIAWDELARSIECI